VYVYVRIYNMASRFFIDPNNLNIPHYIFTTFFLGKSKRLYEEERPTGERERKESYTEGKKENSQRKIK